MSTTVAFKPTRQPCDLGLNKAAYRPSDGHLPPRRGPPSTARASYILAILSSEYLTLSNSWDDFTRLNEYISA
jgi:hypothetical protein